jgi:hypothetical protein
MSHQQGMTQTAPATKEPTTMQERNNNVAVQGNQIHAHVHVLCDPASDEHSLSEMYCSQHKERTMHKQ